MFDLSIQRMKPSQQSLLMRAKPSQQSPLMRAKLGDTQDKCLDDIQTKVLSKILVHVLLKSQYFKFTRNEN